jgi:hypothetical protein
MANMRAKVQVGSIEVTAYGEKLSLSPVCSSSFGPNGESEDNTFARFTPSGSIVLQINNPDLYGKFKPGQKFYVEFTEAQ